MTQAYTNIHILPLATNISQPEVFIFSFVAFLKPQLQSEESILHALNVKFQKTQESSVHNFHSLSQMKLDSSSGSLL